MAPRSFPPCQTDGMSSRLRWVLSQASTGSAGRAALQRLLDPEALPGTGWRRLDQRTWRTGAVADPEPWQSAARAAGSVTAWCSFNGGKQWLWIQTTPLADAADAAAALATAGNPTASLRNLHARVQTVARREPEPPVVVGADLVSATEQTTTGPEPVYTLRCTAGACIIVLCASGSGWTWEQVTGLAEQQLRLLNA
jgi:hypothetical protein